MTRQLIDRTELIDYLFSLPRDRRNQVRVNQNSDFSQFNMKSRTVDSTFWEMRGAGMIATNDGRGAATVVTLLDRNAPFSYHADEWYYAPRDP